MEIFFSVLQRPAQIVIQQPSTPVPPTSPFLTPTPTLAPLTPRPLPSLPSTPTGIGQKFVIVSQARPATPIAPPTTITPVVKLVNPQPAPLSTASSAATTQKIVVIQSGPKSDEMSVGVRAAVLGGPQTASLTQQPVVTTTSNSNISGKETL